MREERQRQRDREKGGHERGCQARCQPCRSDVKNDVCGCSDRRARMDPVLHRRHYITDTQLMLTLIAPL